MTTNTKNGLEAQKAYVEGMTRQGHFKFGLMVGYASGPGKPAEPAPAPKS